MNILHLQFDTEIRTLYQVGAMNVEGINESYLAYVGADYDTRFGSGNELFKKIFKLPEISLHSVFYLPTSLRYRKMLNELKRIVKDNNINVIHVHKRTDIQCLLALDTGVPTVVDSHDLICVLEDSISGSNGYAPFRLPLVGLLAKSLFMKKLRKLEHKTFMRSRIIIAVSPLMKESIIHDHDIDPGKIRLMPNTVPLSYVFPKKVDRPNMPLRILFATSFHLNENARSGREITKLIELLGNNKNISVYLCGMTDSKSEELIEKYCLQYTNIHYLGFFPPHKYQSIIRNYDAGLIFNNTRFDAAIGDMSLPKKLFEYASNGLPIIANNTRQISRFLDEYGAGVTFDDRSDSSLNNAIEGIVENYQEYSKNALKMIVDHFNWNQQSRDLNDIYEKLV